MELNDYKVRLEIFEGPLDLLLYLIKKDELDIQAISLELITTQYLDYINTFKLLNIDLAAEFILMAANLIYIKSRSLLPLNLLPPDEETDEDDPRWDLIRQLIEYKKFKDAASFLSEHESEQAQRFAHQNSIEKPRYDTPPDLADISVFELIRSFQKAIKRFENMNDCGDIVDDRFTVADKITLLLQSFNPGQEIVFDHLFEQSVSKAEVIVTFLAILELMKLNQFVIFQQELLGEIVIKRQTS